jgi:prepilin-type N-terminal cleavage/methylation domain-containing protein
MIFHKLGLINKDQKGFTLIEVLVVTLITGIVSYGATMAISQVYGHNTRSAAHMTAIKQVENAARWIGRDAVMAQNVEPSGASGFPLNLTWVGWDNTLYQVTYSIEDDKLRRSYSADGGGPSQNVVAQYIDSDPAKTHCELTAGGTFNLPDINDTFTITGSAVADDGKITLSAGSISVATTGTATYGEGNWATPATGDTVVVTASAPNTQGIWTSTARSASTAITTDTDGDATVTGKVLRFEITATLGEGSYLTSETAVREVAPRPGL